MEFGIIAAQALYYLKQVGDLVWAKLGFGLLCAALMPHQLALQGLALMTFIDLACGVWVAVKTHSLSSAGMRRGLSKILIYTVFICAVALGEHTVLGTEFCTVGAIGLLAATELLSITENLVMLGLPVPYGAQVLRLVSRKAKNFGFAFNSEDADGLAYAKDLVDIIRVHVPKITDRRLSQIMELYCSGWYAYIRDLGEQPFMGGRDLAWERVRAGLERTMVEIQNQMTRADIPLASQKVFIGWTTELMGRFFSQAQEVCMSEKLAYGDKPERIREMLALMLYRLLAEVNAVDALYEHPLDQATNLVLKPGISVDIHHEPTQQPGEPKSGV